MKDKLNITVRDNFLPLELLKKIKNLKDKLRPDFRDYIGDFAPVQDDLFEELKNFLQKEGFQISRMVARLKKSHRIIQGRGNLVHSDYPYQWVIICYLTYFDESQSLNLGTHFWEHTLTGKTEGDYTSSLETLKTTALILRDTVNPQMWKKMYVVPYQFNRAVIFPAHLFHSQSPEEWCAPIDKYSLDVFLSSRPFTPSEISLVSRSDL